MSDWNALNERLTAWEREGEALKAEIAKANGSAAPAPSPPRPPIEEGTRTLKHLVPIPSEGIPDDKELESLFRIVCRQHPIWAPKARDGESAIEAFGWQLEAFRNAFYAVQLMGRAEKPNTKRNFSFWIDHANEVLIYNNIVLHRDLGRCFALALFAVGNVAYTKYDAGFSISVALAHWGTYRGDAAAWRKVLTTGQTLPPIVLDHQRVEPHSRQQLLVGGICQW